MINGDDDDTTPEEEIHDLTSVIDDIDIDDPANDKNETHMIDVDGKEIEFNEDE